MGFDEVKNNTRKLHKINFFHKFGVVTKCNKQNTTDKKMGFHSRKAN